jgi:hypothetical protein
MLMVRKAKSPAQRAGPSRQEPGPTISRHQATDRGQPIANPVPASERYAAALRRRRAGSWRLPPLTGCGRRDPLDNRDYEREVSDRELASWRAAWRHLDQLDLPAIIPARVVAAGQDHRRSAA